ncbi:hypothetical protein BJ508DRAFT_14326 [Ascobolus immersus RN42]|uniref:LEM-like domain-containing protein n=1 Tax=Ascobolus immersus RN42 TaxID=1160509 RepID=A0A3N4IGC3_ASCIM|nr:hypothetical protein BJ508DRAFT_14326 [Ascobolus immersus RN42]
MDDFPSYLQPGFDPNNLRVAELRGILVEHDVDYPASAKKSELVDLFKTHIAPKSKRLLSAKKRIQPSARGIVDYEDEDEEPDYEQQSTRRAPRTSSRRSLAPSDDAPVRTPARRTRPSDGVTPSVTQSSRRISDKVPALQPPRQTTEERPDWVTPKNQDQRRKSRKSLTAVLNSPDDEDDDSEDEVFSKQNPFQSPAHSSTSGDASVRRRSLISPDKRRVSSTTTARPLRMSLPAYQDKLPKTPARTSQSSAAPSTPDHLNAQLHRELTQREELKEESEDEDHYDQGDDQAFEPHEEFAPNAGAEVKPKPVVKRKRQTPKPPRGIFGFLLISLLSAFFIWWRREKIAVGYCGVGQYGMDGPTGPITASNFYLPRCEVCPPHAICKPDFQTECQDDYVLVPNKYSLAGLIPLAPTCEADSEKLRRIAVLSNEAVRILRKRAADIKCGDTRLDKGEHEGISESNLKRELYRLKSVSIPSTQIDIHWITAPLGTFGVDTTFPAS